MDPDAELKKQIDLAKENLIMLSAMEKEASERIRDRQDFSLWHQKREVEHTQWVVDMEMAAKQHDRFMVEIDRKLKALVAAVKDLNSGKQPPQFL